VTPSSRHAFTFLRFLVFSSAGMSIGLLFPLQGWAQPPQPTEISAWGQFYRFTLLGILHIFTGYDHILFLLGVLLVGGTLKTIIKIVTSFTIAHSITLALAALSVVTPPPRLVEVAIALSIIYIAMENLFVQIPEKRWLVTFLFGLVHGFGFAGMLRQLGLPQKGLLIALFSFNLGVEIGQVAIVAVVFPYLIYIRRFPWHSKVLKGMSLTILGFGLFWFFQRTFF